MKKCKLDDLPRILNFYQRVIQDTEMMPLYGRWIYGLHPTEEMITDYIWQGAMYCLEEDGVITAAVAVTLKQEADYHDLNWEAALLDDQVAVVHLLAVNPKYQHQGIARQIMQEVMEFARDSDMKAVRLDALECNTPAHRLYQSLGFIKRDRQHWYTSNTGWIDFYLFEHIL